MIKLKDREVMNLYKTIDSNEFIVLSNYKTYPKEMRQWLNTYRIKEFINEFNEDMIINFIEILCNYNMVFFQSTRLLSHEIDYIKKSGLRSASRELYNYKITEAFEHSCLSKNDFKKLILENLCEKENRRNKIFCFVNPDNIVHNNSNYYLYNYWGGEITTQNKNYRKYSVLQKIGMPCLIAFKFSLNNLKKDSIYCFENIVKKIIYEYNNKNCAASLIDVNVNIPNISPIPILDIYELDLSEI